MSKIEHREPWRLRLREAIDATGKKHSHIAGQVGIDPTTLSRILNGHIQPNFETVIALAREAGVSVGWLLNERRYVPTARERAVIQAAVIILDRLTKE